jgi:GntR family transcriptional regulator/MocR family aminotransferase
MGREGQLVEVLLPLERGDGPLHAQVERSLRDAIRGGRLRPGTALPSTRALARELGVSRGVVFEAYGQLAAEGYLVARQGAATRVAEGAAAGVPRGRPSRVFDGVAHDLLPGRPDLASFPRQAWLASWRRALREAPDAALGYADPRGAVQLRDTLSAYLGRARAVAPDPQRTVIVNGVSQGVVLVARVLARAGHAAIAVEDPGFHLHRWGIERAGLRPVGVPVDAAGLDVAALAASGCRSVLVTPAHQMPTGAVLSADRRAELLAWAREVDGLVIEDDYDAEYRFDREPIGALQGVDPEHVVYAGSASKALANGLRLGWLVAPAALARELALERFAADGGGPVVEQLALADLIDRGELDRHLRRTRRLYRRRRDAVMAALAEHLPEASVAGVAAGLHVLVHIPDVPEPRVVEAARAAGLALQALGELRVPAAGSPAQAGTAGGVVLGYAHLSEPAIGRAVAALGEAVRRAREEPSGGSAPPW